MKTMFFKLTVKYAFFLSILVFISCTQRTIEHVNKQTTSNNSDVLYYYRNYYCFDFVKRCELEIVKLIKLDTLIYVSSSESHGYYEEIHGKLTKINDSIYFVKSFKHLLQAGNGDEPFYIAKDTIFFFCNSSLINTNIKIEYLNGEVNQYQIYSTMNKFWINEKLFNKKSNRIYLSFSYKNPIVDENVEIVSKYDDPKYCVSFTFKENLDDFYIIIKENQIKTLNIGTENHQNYGVRFNLDKMEKHTQLPKGRKLYNDK